MHEEAISSLEPLVLRAQAGSLEAFEEIVERFESRLLTYLRYFTRNAHDAEDLTQDTFVKAYRGLGHFDPRRSLSAWLFTIARRTAISHFRASRSVPSGTPDDYVQEADTEDPAHLTSVRDDGAALWALTHRLKPRQREVLWLHYAEDLPVVECARVMGLTQIHVKVLLHRGRLALARLLRDHPHLHPAIQLEKRP